jgi:hypothetical protein
MTVELHPQLSSDDATPTAWAEARERLEKAEMYWLTTVICKSLKKRSIASFER